MQIQMVCECGNMMIAGCYVSTCQMCKTQFQRVNNGEDLKLRRIDESGNYPEEWETVKLNGPPE